MTRVFLCFWAMLLLSRGTPFGNALNRWMVERPAAWLSRIHSGHLALAATLAGLAGAMAWMGGEDALRMFGMAMPDAAAWFATVELSSLADVLVVVATAFSAVRSGPVRGWMRAAARRPSARRLGRARARRNAPVHCEPANDEGGSTGWVVAA